MLDLTAPPGAAGADAPRAAWVVLVVDDVRSIRDGLRMMIVGAFGAAVQVGTAASVVEAVDSAAHQRPDVVLLDVDLQGDDGLRLVRLLDAAVRIVVMTSHTDDATRRRAEALGVQAFVGKHEPAERVLLHLAPPAPSIRGGSKLPSPAGQAYPAGLGAFSVVGRGSSR